MEFNIYTLILIVFFISVLFLIILRAMKSIASKVGRSVRQSFPVDPDMPDLNLCSASIILKETSQDMILSESTISFTGSNEAMTLSGFKELVEIKKDLGHSKVMYENNSKK